jgi:hypothetical protein
MMALYGKLRTADKHQFKIELPIHPDHITLGNPNPWGTRNVVQGRDPRKVWCYDCCSGKFAVEDVERRISGSFHHYRLYRFEKEHDLLMFTLRWSSSDEDL